MPNLSRSGKITFHVPLILLALIAVALPTGVSAQSEENQKAQDKILARPRRTVESGAVPKEPLPNFHEVHPFLYRGGEPNAVGLRKLKAIGVASIIDLRAATPLSLAEEADAKTLDLKYTRLPMSNKAPTKAQVATFMEQTREARDKNAPIYVHCAHGSDRTGCMIGIWRVSEDGYSFDRAYKEMRKYYFGPQFTLLSGAVRARAQN